MSPISTPNGSSVSPLLAVQDELAKLLGDPSFKNSKRLSEFLSYIVEHALTGNISQIKERTIGIELFGRSPTYDTDTDASVRVTATTVRKRLEEYYCRAENQRIVQIKLPRGSYVPVFIPLQDTSGPAQQGDLAVNHRFRMNWKFVFGVPLALLIVGAVFSLRSNKTTAYDLFWSPLFHSKAPMWLCIPDLTDDVAARTIPDIEPSPLLAAAETMQPIDRRDQVSFVDASVLLAVTRVLGSEGQAFRLFHASDLRPDDLKGGPGLLVGGLRNHWTTDLDLHLRFTVMRAGKGRYILDRKHPDDRNWSVNPTTDTNVRRTYAVVSRVMLPMTGQVLFIASGLPPAGTAAAAICLSNPRCFADARAMAPGDWKHGNVQIVLQADILNGTPGEPKVIAAEVTSEK